MSDDSEDMKNCSMVGLLGILIQVGLGALSFSFLIIKRFFENPKRPWKIWSFDASKQMISQLIAHFINLTISIELSYNRQNSDECLWYFVTNVFDNTVGVFICLMMLKFIENNLRKKRRFELISGNYYRKIDPLSLTHQGNVRQQHKQPSVPHIDKIYKTSVNPQLQIKDKNNEHRKSFISEGDSRMQAFNIQHQKKAQKEKESHVPEQNQVEDNFIYIIDYKAWILQLAIWNGIVIIGKCVLFGLQFGLEKQLQQFSIYILGWIEKYPVIELLVVMVLVPVIMNGLAYWVQDNFLMKHEKLAQQKNLIEEHLKDIANLHLNDELGRQFMEEKEKENSAQIKQFASTRSRRESQIEGNGGRFEFHDDYDAKDDENPSQKFDKIFDKFGKFTL